MNTAARCTSSPGTGINVRGSANAPKGGPVPKAAVPGSMKLPGTVDAGSATTQPPTEGMAGLLGLGGGS